MVSGVILREHARSGVVEVDRLREEVDQACAMFSRYTWPGALDMPREFHVSRGRRMAMLKTEAADLPCPDSTVR